MDARRENPIDSVNVHQVTTRFLLFNSLLLSSSFLFPLSLSLSWLFSSHSIWRGYKNLLLVITILQLLYFYHSHPILFFFSPFSPFEFFTPTLSFLSLSLSLVFPNLAILSRSSLQNLWHEWHVVQSLQHFFKEWKNKKGSREENRYWREWNGCVFMLWRWWGKAEKRGWRITIWEERERIEERDWGEGKRDGKEDGGEDVLTFNYLEGETREKTWKKDGRERRTNGMNPYTLTSLLFCHPFTHSLFHLSSLSLFESSIFILLFNTKKLASHLHLWW